MDDPVVLLTQIIQAAVESSASDIHIDPKREWVEIRFREQGVLREFTRYDNALHDQIVRQVMVRSSMRIDDTLRPQDGRCVWREGVLIDMRVAVCPALFGQAITMRLIRSEQSAGLLEIGIRPDAVEVLHEGLMRKGKAIIIAGATGSGKTTTACALLTHIQTSALSVISLEDPIEYVMSFARQIQINHSVGLSFATVLRTILRQNPDVVFVGEIRDAETARVAMNAALTGHKVISTIHSHSARQALARLRDMGVEAYVIRAAIGAILFQQLVPSIRPTSAGMGRVPLCEYLTMHEGADSPDDLQYEFFSIKDDVAHKTLLGMFDEQQSQDLLSYHEET